VGTHKSALAVDYRLHGNDKFEI